LPELKIASLTEQDLRAVQGLEADLGGRYCLLVVEKPQVLYAVEAKMAPNEWRPVNEVYPIENLRSFFQDKTDALAAKASLKSLLIANKDRYRKRPLRVRAMD